MPFWMKPVACSAGYGIDAGVGEFTGPVAVGRPGGGDHGGRGARGGVLREDAADQEGLVVRMAEDAQQGRPGRRRGRRHG